MHGAEECDGPEERHAQDVFDLMLISLGAPRRIRYRRERKWRDLDAFSAAVNTQAELARGGPWMRELIDETDSSSRQTTSPGLQRLHSAAAVIFRR